LIACHESKAAIDVWKWDKREPALRFPTKDKIACVKLVGLFCVAGSEQSANGFGKIFAWNLSTGQMVGEQESAHYQRVNQLEAS